MMVGTVPAGTTAYAIPKIDEYLAEQGFDKEVRDAALLALSAGIGGAVGDTTAGVANSVNQTENNYLSHKQMVVWARRLEGCKGNQSCINEANKYYNNLDKKQNADFEAACFTNYNTDSCKFHISRINSIREQASPISLYNRIDKAGGNKVSHGAIDYSNMMALSQVDLAITQVHKANNQPIQAMVGENWHAELMGGGAGRVSAVTKAKPVVQPRPAKGLCSFRGDMIVETQNGYKPIADIKIGDMVLAKNEFTGEVSYQKVLNQYNNSYQQTVYVTIKDKNGNSQTIVSNKIHPFFTRITNEDNSTLPPSSEGHNYQGDIKNAQWVDASNLKAGYELLSEDGKWQVVQHVEVKDEPLSAYNLTVDNDHTYFIAGNYKVEGVWVHNNCWESLPSDAYNTGKTTPDGRPLYSFNDKNGNRVTAYKGSDGRYYNPKAYPPSKPLPTNPQVQDFFVPAQKAKELGYTREIPANKSHFNSHGQTVFYNPKTKDYITLDIDKHNVTNGWKKFDAKGNRLGTFDTNLNYVKK